MESSPRYRLNKEDGIKIAKVFGWSFASFLVVFLLNLLPQLDLPTNAMWILPVINTLLVSAKKFLEK